MGTDWRNKRRSDQYYKRAKEEGYLSRASYKLKQLADEHRIISTGDTVVDLGAAPGGWSQVALERVGPKGRVIAVDLKPIEADGVTTIRGDVTEQPTIHQIRETAGGSVDCVLSDMSPNISGNFSMDHARSVHLAEIALQAAEELLKPGGGFVVKVFQGDMFKGYYDQVGELFDYHKATSPDASRKESSETYVVGERYKG